MQSHKCCYAFICTNLVNLMLELNLRLLSIGRKEKLVSAKDKLTKQLSNLIE